MKTLHLAAALVLAGTSSLACAQMKPGLWEITNKVSGGQMDQQMAQAQQQMASMPPEQRKMFEEMMAKQGVKIGAGGPGGGMSMKICMTREMAERNEVSSGQQRGDCRTTTQSRTGNTMKMAFTCTNPPSSGEGQVTFSGNEAYNMKMVVHTQVQGRPDTMNMEASGRFMGNDCGEVRPMVPRK